MAEARTYDGGCHCGRVKLRATTDLGTVISCNCSHCASKGLLLSFVTPDRFELLSGEDALTDYRFNTHRIAHLFCRDCGVQPFGRGSTREGVQMVALNVRCLDGVDLDALELKRVNGKDL
jgi:hypothetical protein